MYLFFNSIKLVQFYLLTIVIIATDSQVTDEGYLTQSELQYLSKRLYPEECTYLTNALSNSLKANCKAQEQNSIDKTFHLKPEIHCLIELEKWNKMTLKDEEAHERVKKILHEMGRFDLATYLSKNATDRVNFYKSVQ